MFFRKRRHLLLLEFIPAGLHCLKPNIVKYSDIALLPFSSGTTGIPKGVMLTHTNITTNCEMINAKLPNSRIANPTTNSEQDCYLNIVPMHHMYGFTIGLIVKLALGCKIVMLPKFAPDIFLKLLTIHEVSYLHLVPPLIGFLANSPMVEAHHLRSVRSIMSGGSSTLLADANRLKEKYIMPNINNNKLSTVFH